MSISNTVELTIKPIKKTDPALIREGWLTLTVSYHFIIHLIMLF